MSRYNKEESEKIYHCGASSKDAGERVTTITEVPEKDIYNNLIEQLLQNGELKLKNNKNKDDNSIEKL